MSEPSAPYSHGHSLRSARRRRTGCGPCWQEAWGEPQSVCSGSCSLFRSSLYLSRAVYLLPGQRYSISWPYKAALNFPKPTRCPPWSSSVAADPRGGKADRNARRRKSPQGRGRGESHLPFIQTTPEAYQLAANKVPRSQAHMRNAPAIQGNASKDSAGDARAREHLHDDGHLLPRTARHARESRERHG